MMSPFYTLTSTPVFSYLNAVTQGMYNKEVISYINDQGIPFAPISMQLKKRNILDDLKDWWRNKQRKLCKNIEKPA
jgi:hypothetical protein